MYHTERENLERQKENLYIFDQQLTKGKFGVEDVADFLPGYFHLNRLEDAGLQYLSRNAEKYLGLSLDEINEVGTKQVMTERCHPTTLAVELPRMLNFIEKEDHIKIFGYSELLRNKKDKDFEKFIGFAKISKELNTLICIENPVAVFGGLSYKLSVLIDDNEFLRRNYKKFSLLTKRETEIIRLIGQGQSRSDIAEQLYISVHTFDNHRKHIREKLNVKTAAELFQYIRAFELY